jgi:hypothetical protein
MNQCPPGPKYSIGAFLNFFEIRGDIRELLLITGVGVNDTGDKLFSVSTTPANNLYFPGVVDTVQKKNPKSLKFITVVNDTAVKLFTVSTIPQINFLAVSATPAIRESC